MTSKCLHAVLVLLVFSALSLGADKIGYHEVKTDASGRIVPWYGTGPSQAYDHIIRLVFDFWLKMRKCPNGVPYYLQHQVWKPGADDPRGLGGDQIPMALYSWNLLHGYLGDPAVKQNMILMADYWLAHGMSQPDILWGNLPYPYNTEIHSGQYRRGHARRQRNSTARQSSQFRCGVGGAVQDHRGPEVP